MRSIAGGRPNRAGKNRTLHAIERPRAESNRRERARFERVAYIQAVSLSLSGRTCDASHIPRPCGCSYSHERATAGGRYGLCDTAGSRTPQRGKTSQKLATLRAMSACVVTTWRGKSIHNSMKKNRGEWGVEPRSTQESRNRSRHSARRLTTDAGNTIINHQ